MEAGELNAKHIGNELSFGDRSGELRQIYHLGDYPDGETFVYLGEHCQEIQLRQTDQITVYPQNTRNELRDLMQRLMHEAQLNSKDYRRAEEFLAKHLPKED